MLKPMVPSKAQAGADMDYSSVATKGKKGKKGKRGQHSSASAAPAPAPTAWAQGKQSAAAPPLPPGARVVAGKKHGDTAWGAPMDPRKAPRVAAQPPPVAPRDVARKVKQHKPKGPPARGSLCNCQATVHGLVRV